MDIQHHTICAGDGPALLLLHGNGEDSTYFEHQIEDLSSNFFVCAIDTRGHGGTPMGEAPFTLSQFADDLFDFMNEHEIEQADLLGFSDGGNIAMIFASDLMRRIDLPVQYDSFAVSSYVNTHSTGELKVRSALKLSLENRHVLLIDDILDTGFTLKCIIRDFLKIGALSVRSCVLLNKNIKDKLFAEPDWVGFEISDEFVVGYGLDYNEEYRNLPYIGILQQ